MAESIDERERLANSRHFGLAENVSEAVRDYYDLLFDNAKEFIGMNHEEIQEYEKENAELAAKLAGGGLDQSEEKSAAENIVSNINRIGEIKDFLNSEMVMPVSLDLAGQVLDGSEPDLADQFAAAPIAEKYTCLAERYMAEYSKDFQAPAGTHSPIDDYAFHFAEEMIEELFPKIAEQYGKHKQAEYKKLLKDDPTKIYDSLMEKYAAEYIDDAGKHLSSVTNDRDALQSRLLEHGAAKPGWLKNLTTLGTAGKAWAGERDALAREIAGHENQIAELQKIGEGGKGADLPEFARREVENTILSRHPEVAEAREQHMARRWEEANAARLEHLKEKQVERESGDEHAPDSGPSR